MPALLESTPATYVDPRASILYGGGNSNISDADIKAYINTPGVTDADIMSKALANGVSANQISSAMTDSPGFSSSNIDKYVSSQGVSKEQTPVQYALPQAAAAPAPVQFQPIAIGSSDTVQGQLSGILNDKNNPLMVQASTAGKQYANQRGMLNSSIGAGAAESAMIGAATPIAQQDASTNFAAKQQNAQGALTADTFNADVTSRTNMFNTGAAKDIYTANMDTQNKLAIANVQAMANDSGIMGDLGKTALTLYAQIAADPNMTPEVKTATVNRIDEGVRGYTSLLSSITSSAEALTFGQTPQANVSNAEAAGNAAGASTPVSTSSSPANVLGYQVEPSTMSNVIAYENATGTKVDPAKVAPEQLVMDIKTLGQAPSTYLSSDGTNKTTNNNSYDVNALFKQYNVSNVGDLFNAMFVAVQPPGTMRADAPMFYVYR